MKKINLVLFAAMAAISLSATQKTMSLEWNKSYPSDTAYEVEIDRSKLEKLAGVSKSSTYTVVATVNGKKQKLATSAYPGKTQNSIALRFTVPAGTTELACVPGDGKIAIKDAVKSENLFAGALEAKNIKKWKLSKDIAITSISNGIRLDAKLLNKKVSAAYTVDVPEDAAGRPVKLELDVKSISKMAWPNTIYIQQLDADGKVLPEFVTDTRWITQMRPTNILTQYRESGLIRPDAKKLRIYFGLYAVGVAYNNHGMPLKNKDDVTPHLEISRLVLRSAEQLPFPKYNDIFFADGVTGDKHDKSVALKDDRMLFFSTRSMAMWGGQATEIRNEKEFYFPTGDGTVEAFIKPVWSKQNKNVILFDAKNFLVRTKGYSERGVLFQLAYNPKKKVVSVLVQGADSKNHKVSGKVEIPAKEWSHIAVQWSEAKGIEFYLNGKLAFSKKCDFKAIDISKEKNPNDSHALQFTIGNTTGAARGRTVIPSRYPSFNGQLDVLRISNIARYNGSFTPDKNAKADGNTNVIFDFNRSFDGTTLYGTGRVFNAVRSINSKVDRKLTIGGKTVNYYPEIAKPDADPRVVLDPLNYPVLPSVGDFKTARKSEKITFTAKPGDSRNIKLDSDVIMDYIEYANNSDKILAYPLLIKKGEIDPRSFGDLADSLGIDGLTPKGKVNKIFQFLLASSDYFMNHQATFLPGSDLPENVEYKALMMLNGYCGFECGPLNNLSANLFTTAGLCPASQTAGYGHSFESVFYDGKGHVYDLSAQKFFTSADNESAASLDELEQEPGLFIRMAPHNNNDFTGSGDHFVRLGNRKHGAQMPSYQEKVGMILNPGEKLRIYFFNDGMVNDLQCAHHLNLGALEQATYYEKETGAKVTRPNRKIYRIDRYFPHYANAFLVFNGKPQLKNPAFKAAKDGFCYNVKSCYPIVYGEYSAELADGSFADIAISTDRGKTFRTLEKDADGVVREDYKVRARQAYIIKVKAPISKVVKFKAATEMQVNPRILTSKLAKGNNELLFKAVSGKQTDVTLQYRKAAKEIAIEGAFYNGVIPGHERQTALLDPDKGVELKVSGASEKAQVKTSSGVAATLKDGKLIITAKEGKLPRFDFVEIDDNGAKKELTLIVARNAQLVGVEKATKLKNAKLVKAGDKLIQSVVELSDAGSKMSLPIAPVKEGKYTVWVLTRFNSHLRPSSGPRSLSMRVKGNWQAVAGVRNTGAEFYKAQYGKPGERAQFKWDYPLKYRYPYQRPTSVTLRDSSKLDFKVSGNSVGVTEVAAVLIMPEQDTEFLNQMIKILCGYNHEPWKLAEANKEIL
ncbi:MAG: LamG domain-containing protein [Lentisphaeria bacterium]|nr:LamG domain-containing protein [Lentisphaeria bacterium]